MWSFRPKVNSPEVASHTLVKVDPTDDKQHSTTPLIKDAFCLDYFAVITKNRSSVCTILEISTIASSILNIFCIKSSLQNVVDHYMLSLSL